MSTDAPLEYVKWYYETDHVRWETFPDVTEFIGSFLREVDAEQVLNAGCGPQFYDHMLRFGSTPKRYVGIDVSRSTICYLNSSSDERMVQAREAANSKGVTIRTMCASIFDVDFELMDPFGTVIASGFIGTFHGEQLDRLCQVLHGALRPGGKLVKLTWHGPHRPAEQTSEKLKYGYDSLEEHEPNHLQNQICANGFAATRSEMFECNPDTYKWDVIQGCVFVRV